MHANHSSVSVKATPSAMGRMHRYLGLYLAGLCLYQVGIYQWPGGPPFILDPRAGIAVLLINHFSANNRIVYPIEWITVTWLAFLAVAIFLRGRFLKVYIASELLLAAPTAYYIVLLAVLHGGDFAPGFHDLLITICFFLAYSVIPIALALWTLRRKPGAA